MPRNTTTRTPRTPAMSGTTYLPFPADRIHKAICETIIALHKRPDHPIQQVYFDKSETDYDALFLSIGLERELREDELAIVKNNPGLLVQIHYLLWADCYETMLEVCEEVERLERRLQAPGRATRLVPHITLQIPYVCDKLGIARLAGGWHRADRKREVMAALRLLTLLRIRYDYVDRKRKKPHSGEGCAWIRVVEEKELKRSEEFPEWPALPQMQEVATSFCYAPGIVFREKEWRVNNHGIGAASRGLVELELGDKYKAAALLGGYLTALGRMAKYQPKRIRVSELEEWTCLAGQDKDKPGRRRKRLEAALMTLCCAGVIEDWEDLAADDKGARVLIRWPRELQELGKIKDPKARRAAEKDLTFRGKTA